MASSVLMASSALAMAGLSEAQRRAFQRRLLEEIQRKLERPVIIDEPIPVQEGRWSRWLETQEAEDMPKELWFTVRREPGGKFLAPGNPDTEDFVKKRKVGTILKVKASVTRNPAHHRKFFALLRLILHHQEKYTTELQILYVFKYHLGFGEWIDVTEPDDRTHRVFVPGSISFAKMDQAEFEGFYRDCIHIVQEHMIPGLEDAELEKELESFIGG